MEEGVAAPLCVVEVVKVEVVARFVEELRKL
jgi:hypothetical protein